MDLRCLVWTLTSVLFAFGRTAAGADAPDTLTYPQLAKGEKAVDWPGALDREARVVVRMTIEIDGTASSVTTDPGFHQERFTRAVLKGIPKMRWTPALRGGKPVRYEDYRMAFNFTRGDHQWANGLTPPFRAALESAMERIKEKNLAAAHAEIRDMVANKTVLVYENVVMQAMLAKTFDETGKPHAALSAAREATVTRVMSAPVRRGSALSMQTARSDFLLPEPLLSQALLRRLKLDLQFGHVVDAFLALHSWSSLQPSVPADFIAEWESLNRKLQGNETLAADVELGEDRVWHHSPARPSFTIALLTGALDSIVVDCGGQSNQTFRYEADRSWKLPDSWERCDLVFSGTNGARFRIIELGR